MNGRRDDRASGRGERELFRRMAGTAYRADPAAPLARGVSLKLATFAFVGLISLTLAGPYMTIVATGGALSGEGNILRQLGYIAFLLLAIVSVGPHRHPGRLIAMPVLMLVALGWCWLSVSWAVEPDIAVRRVLLTTIAIWSVFLLVRQLGYERTVGILRILLLIALVANFLAVFLFPQIGIHQSDEAFDKALIGDWRGVMAHKNIAGLTSALTVLLFAFESGRVKLALRAPVIALAIAFLFFSGSRTSLGVCLAAAGVGLLFLGYRGRYRAILLGLGLLGAVCIAAYFSAFNDPLLRNLDDPTAFTGRVEIWNTLLRYIADNPYTGAGFGSFWNVGGSSPVYRYGRDWVLDLAQGHNGFLDLLATIGIPGLVLVLAATAAHPVAQLLSTRASEGARGALTISLLVFCLAHNFTETSLFDRDTIGQVFLMCTVALIGTLAPSKLSSERKAAVPRPRRRVDGAGYRPS